MYKTALYLLTFLICLLFSLLLTILILWLEEAELPTYDEFPTLSDLIRTNARGIQALYISFYSIFCITALLLLAFDIHWDEGVQMNGTGCCTRKSLSNASRFTYYTTARLIYVATTLYAIVFLLMLLLIDNGEKTNKMHLVYASLGFGSLVVRSLSLFFRRLYIRSSPCEELWSLILAYTLNAIFAFSSLFLLILLPTLGMPELECALTFTLLPDPFFQLMDYWVEIYNVRQKNKSYVK